MVADYDVIVVGSGFGGAVAACRLAQAGMRVCILERGRWWPAESFPLHNWNPGAWLWTKWTKGLYQHYRFKKLDVIVASGVGGGSLVYTNVLIAPPAEAFNKNWPSSITLAALKPYYQRVRNTLHPTAYPRASFLSKTRALANGAKLIGRQKDFTLLDLAVYWGQPGVPHQDPYGFGNQQTGCLDLGECFTGCPLNAKNTLDLNYISLALKHGAECRSLHEATYIARQGHRYKVHYLDRSGFIPRRGHISAPRVVLSAGSLGSTGILLHSVKTYRTLNPLSPALGRGFSANGSFMASLMGIAPKVDFTAGPTITSGIHYPEEQIIIEDGGLPPVSLLKMIQGLRLFNALPLLLMGRDAADGRIELKGKSLKLTLSWSPQNSMPLFDTMEQRVKELAAALKGRALFLPTWSLFRKLVTVHPLGGCPMADSPQEGVVNDCGAVYGHPGLYVADGSIVPTSLGINPAFTIAALAERIAENIHQRRITDK